MHILLHIAFTYMHIYMHTTCIHACIYIQEHADIYGKKVYILTYTKAMIKIFVIRFNPQKHIFDDTELNAFLSTHNIKRIEPAFFEKDGKFYWTILVEYEPVSIRASRVKGMLNRQEQVVYEKLTEWRREIARKEGIPIFIVATNSQLIQMIKLRATTKERLKQIKGFGTRRIEKYGNDIIEIIKSYIKGDEKG